MAALQLQYLSSCHDWHKHRVVITSSPDHKIGKSKENDTATEQNHRLQEQRTCVLLKKTVSPQISQDSWELKSVLKEKYFKKPVLNYCSCHYHFPRNATRPDQTRFDKPNQAYVNSPHMPPMNVFKTKLYLITESRISRAHPDRQFVLMHRIISRWSLLFFSLCHCKRASKLNFSLDIWGLLRHLCYLLHYKGFS